MAGLEWFGVTKRQFIGNVIQSKAKDLGGIHVYVIEILPPCGRLNDKYEYFFLSSHP